MQWCITMHWSNNKNSKYSSVLRTLKPKWMYKAKLSKKQQQWVSFRKREREATKLLKHFQFHGPSVSLLLVKVERDLTQDRVTSKSGAPFLNESQQALNFLRAVQLVEGKCSPWKRAGLSSFTWRQCLVLGVLSGVVTLMVVYRRGRLFCQ